MTEPAGQNLSTLSPGTVHTLHPKITVAMQSSAIEKPVSQSVAAQNVLSPLMGTNGKPIIPNGLRNGVYRALSRLGAMERVPVYKRLLRELERPALM